MNYGTETKGAVQVGRREVVAIRQRTVVGCEVPATAAKQPVRTRSRANGVGGDIGVCVIMPVGTPFPNITAHVEQRKGCARLGGYRIFCAAGI